MKRHQSLGRLRELCLGVTCFLLAGLASQRALAAENWKGTPEPSAWALGAMGGLALIDSSTAFTVVGTASIKVIPHGFVNDLADSVSVEAQLGPAFFSQATSWHYSGHLRWDFEFNSDWDFYALGGLAGNVTSYGGLVGTRNEFFPRFGAGAIWKGLQQVQLRFELSHEFFGAGVLFRL